MLPKSGQKSTSTPSWRAISKGSRVPQRRTSRSPTSERCLAFMPCPRPSCGVFLIFLLGYPVRLAERAHSPVHASSLSVPPANMPVTLAHQRVYVPRGLRPAALVRLYYERPGAAEQVLRRGAERVGYLLHDDHVGGPARPQFVVLYRARGHARLPGQVGLRQPGLRALLFKLLGNDIVRPFP